MTPELSPSEQLNLAEIEALVARKNLDPSIPPHGVTPALALNREAGGPILPR